jgi:hypothetical protein
MLLDLPPWLQTVLAVVGVLLLASPYVGQLMVQSNPGSVWGRRLMLGGIWIRAFASKPKVYAALPAPVRVIMASLPEIDPADMPVMEAAAKASERTGHPVLVEVVAEEKPKEPTGMPRKSSRPPPLVTMVLLVALAGCHNTASTTRAGSTRRAPSRTRRRPARRRSMP